MNAKLARKRSKAATSTSEPTLDLPPTPIVTDQPIVSAPAPAAPPVPPPASTFAKIASEILTPDMSDVEKLQKLKEYILADQHPFFTSAPKVAHLLSLRDPNSKFDASVPTGDYDRETASYQPATSIPLAERLSSPGTRTNGNSQEYHAPDSSPVNHRPRSDSQIRNDGMNIDYPRRDQDVEMSDSSRFEPSGPTLDLSQGQGYQRQSDMPGGNERSGYDDGGRRSPRGDSRGWNKWDDGRGSNGDPSRLPAEINGRYGEAGGRYGPGSYRGGYGNQGNRRYSLNDRSNADQRYNDNHRNIGKRTEYGYDHPDQRRSDDSAPAGGNKDSNFYNARGSYDRRIEEPSQPKSPQATAQALQVEPTEEVKPEEETHSPAKEVAENIEVSTLDVVLTSDPKEEPANGTDSPVSLGPGLPPSTTDSTLPAIPSPDRTEAAMDSQSVKGQEEKSIPNRSPPSNDGRDGKPQFANNRNVRPYIQRDYNRYHPDNRPLGNAYQKPFGNRPYERPRDVRDERLYILRDPPPTRDYHRAPLPAHAPAPLDDRRFVPRETGYVDEPGYARRDYRPDWEAKRDDRPPLDRSYDRDRDRDYRAPVPLSPRGAPKLPLHTAPPHQRYPPERGPSRPVGSERPLHDPYSLPPPNDHRGYGRDSYGEPLPPASSAYREPPPPRIRPRSLSPPRRDYRQDDRPPAKRMRGPEPTYPPPSNPGGQYASSNYGPPSGRTYDYPAADRRPPPQGPAQGAYYRPDDRGPARY